MRFLGGLALILFTLVGYSTGNVMLGQRYRVIPGLYDILTTGVLWTCALLTRSALGRGWAILVWLLAGVAAGAIAFLLRKRYPLDKPVSASSIGKSLPQRILARWRGFASRLGDFQGRILLIWFYFVLVTPFALLARIGDDPLHLGSGSATSHWVDRTESGAELASSRKQF